MQLIINAWNKFAVGVGLGQCSTLIAPYILFNPETKLFRVLEASDDGYAPTSQRTTLFNVGKAVAKEACGFSDIRSRPLRKDEAFQYVTASMFAHHHSFLLNSDLY